PPTNSGVLLRSVRGVVDQHVGSVKEIQEPLAPICRSVVRRFRMQLVVRDIDDGATRFDTSVYPEGSRAARMPGRVGADGETVHADTLIRHGEKLYSGSHFLERNREYVWRHLRPQCPLQSLNQHGIAPDTYPAAVGEQR